MRWRARLAMGAAIMIVAMGVQGSPAAGDRACQFRVTDGALVLDNGLVSLEFDTGTGAVTDMRNLATGGEYIKGDSGDGNPFRAYVDTTEVPRVLRLAFPWPVQPVEDAMGGRLVDPRSCLLVEHSFRRQRQAGQLRLVSRHADLNLTFELTVRLPDNDVAADLDLIVRNHGAGARRVMVAVPYLTGLGLGNDRNSNQGVRLVGFGQSRGAAWENCGDLYGRIWSGQWNAVYDPSANEALGIIAKDKDLRNKVVRRFPGGGMSVFYTDDHPLAPGGAIRYPTSQILVYAGDWKPTARRYGKWFDSAFKLRQHAKWLDDVDAYTGAWIPKPSAVAEARKRPEAPGAFTSFTQFPRLYLPNTFDLQEWAFYWQGVIVHDRYDSYHHTDGIYDFREDLGGLPAFAEGVARLRKVGRVVGLYLASKTVRNDSRIFAREFAGTRPEDWLLMETPNAELPAPDKDGQLSFWVCPRYGAWQDHLARLCKDLLRRTGARYIRLDELGEAFVVCHNPRHHHSSPYAGTPDILQLLKKVRSAMDEVDPQAALYTEGASDLMQLYCDGTLAMWGSGNELAPMRLALPGFVGLAYGLGQVECALQGFVTGGSDACSMGGWWNPHHASLWGPGLVKRPLSYPAEGQGFGPKLRWREIGYSFVEAVRRGDPADADPLGIGQDREEWAGRIWRARDYWLMVCGDVASRRPARPVQVKVPALPEVIRSAYEIDLETLAIRDAQLLRTGEGASVVLTAGFSAVLLPKPDCPPLLQTDDLLPIGLSRPAELRLMAFAPWRSAASPVRVTVAAPGLCSQPNRLTLPGSLRLSAPPGAEPGYYPLSVTGKCLPLKRWVRVEP